MGELKADYGWATAKNCDAQLSVNTAIILVSRLAKLTSDRSPASAEIVATELLQELGDPRRPVTGVLLGQPGLRSQLLRSLQTAPDILDCVRKHLPDIALALENPTLFRQQNPLIAPIQSRQCESNASQNLTTFAP